MLCGVAEGLLVGASRCLACMLPNGARCPNIISLLLVRHRPEVEAASILLSGGVECRLIFRLAGPTSAELIHDRR
jgi:hypothetical protein